MQQLTRQQYKLLYQYARVEYKHVYGLPAAEQSVRDMATKIGALHKVSPFPRNCFAPMLAHFRQQPIDRLYQKWARYNGFNRYAEHVEKCRLYHAAYRLGQAYERAILYARSTGQPADYDPAIAAEKLITKLTAHNPHDYLWWDYVNGRNSIRKMRGLEEINH